MIREEIKQRLIGRVNVILNYFNYIKRDDDIYWFRNPVEERRKREELRIRIDEFPISKEEYKFLKCGENETDLLLENIIMRM